MTQPQNSQQDDALSDLFKMSPTAGVATTDYASINTFAIVTMLLGLASVLVVPWPDLLFIPLIGLGCGIVSLRQIAASNRTQVGKGLAWAGLAMAVLIGGGTAGYLAFQGLQVHSQEVAIDDVLRRFGQAIHDEHYDAAYAECSPNFQKRVSPENFRSGIATLNSIPQLGRVLSMSWNGEKMIFQQNLDTGEQHATAMAFEQVEKVNEPGRELLGFVKVDGHWKLDEFPRIFPPPKSDKKS